MGKTDSVIFYRSFYDAIKLIEPKKQGEAYKALIEYALEGIDYDGDDVVNVIITMAKPLIDANTSKRIAGTKGGRPTTKNTSKTTTNKSRKSSKKDTENDEILI